MAPFDARQRATFLQRLGRLQPGQRPAFGELTPAGMIAHLTKSIEGSLGDFKIEPQSTVFTRSLFFRLLVLYIVPFPKGRIKVPKFLTPDTVHTPAEELPALQAILARFERERAAEPDRRVEHPVFGPLTLNTWAKFHRKHFEHHCRQFGI
jgi:hypothetical protein